jgi:hypothetical protein
VCVGDDRGFLLLVDVGIRLFTSAKSYHLSLTGRQKSRRMIVICIHTFVILEIQNLIINDLIKFFKCWIYL